MAIPILLKAALYFTLCYLVLNLWLAAELRAAARSDDELNKGKVLLKGLVAHFAFSLLVLIVYYRFVFEDHVGEVLVAMTLYVISFVQYVISGSRLK